MSDAIQPSTDARATAMAVAWDIVRLHTVHGPDAEAMMRQRAELVAELSRTIFHGTSSNEMAKAAGKFGE
jgi:hypothetical protein